MEFKALARTPIFKALSTTGKRIFLPQGIFYWAGMAKKKASINGTIGTAMGNEIKDLLEDGTTGRGTFFIKSMKDHLGTGLKAGNVASYAPIAGLPDLRSTWRDWILEKTGLAGGGMEDAITLPVVTNGLTNGIFFIGKLFADPGDHVLTSSKHWGNYDTILHLNLGATVSTFNTFKGKEFDVEDLGKQVRILLKKQGKLLLLLNFPNNPSGYVPDTTTMKQIASEVDQACKELEKPLIVICDDAYEGYIYDETADTLGLFPYLVERCKDNPHLIPVKLDGASKELLFYGGRVGFMTFAVSPASKGVLEEIKKELDNKLSGMVRSTISNASRVSQELVLQLLSNKVKSFKERGDVINVLKERWTVFMEQCKQIEATSKGIYFDPFQGGFFAFLNLPSSFPAKEIATKLIDDHALGVIPIEKPDIGVNGIRIAYCSMLKSEISSAIDAISKTLQ
ncbi:aminotransferase class I/II-fold pyridoxal phosphate-dependent enzyme [Candidatus Bathyarchaeota archaeon]|nr:aminotransferase class I/II-fold pyridoxal phosphate-dependent enzyme [Candidatus Bathyarchaeota archaeon]